MKPPNTACLGQCRRRQLNNKSVSPAALFPTKNELWFIEQVCMRIMHAKWPPTIFDELAEAGGNLARAALIPAGLRSFFPRSSRVSHV